MHSSSIHQSNISKQYKYDCSEIWEIVIAVNAIYRHDEQTRNLSGYLSHTANTMIATIKLQGESSKDGEEKENGGGGTDMLVLLSPMPQKMEKASTKFSSFFVNGRSLNVFTNCKNKSSIVVWNQMRSRTGALQSLLKQCQMLLRRAQ